MAVSTLCTVINNILPSIEIFGGIQIQICRKTKANPQHWRYNITGRAGWAELLHVGTPLLAVQGCTRQPRHDKMNKIPGNWRTAKSFIFPGISCLRCPKNSTPVATVVDVAPRNPLFQRKCLSAAYCQHS